MPDPTAARQTTAETARLRAALAKQIEETEEIAGELAAERTLLDQLRPLIDAARAWRTTLDGLGDDTSPEEDTLAEAVDALPPGLGSPRRAQEPSAPVAADRRRHALAEAIYDRLREVWPYQDAAHLREVADEAASIAAAGRAQDGQIVYVTPGGAIFAERLGIEGWFGTNGGYARDLAELRTEYGPAVEMRLTDPAGSEG